MWTLYRITSLLTLSTYLKSHPKPEVALKRSAWKLGNKFAKQKTGKKGVEYI